MSVRVFAPAKVNLTLQVGAPRADGLHPLQSVAAFADVGEFVEAAPGDVISLRIDGPMAAGLKAREDNLVLRAARALAEAAGVKQGAALTLCKHMPVASGIGGGSSDAAATLRALNQLWRLDWPAAQLMEVARPLGADAPVCVAARAAYMTGAGETHIPLAAPRFDAVLVNPGKPLATGDVYRRFDAMGLGAGFREAPAPNWATRDAALSAMAAIGNDLEAPARALVPEIGAVAERLRDPRVRYAALSGSGATMFAITDTVAAAVSLAQEIAAARPDWWVRAVVIGAGA